MERHAREPLAESLAAAVRHQSDAPAARQQRARERLGREHVAAGTAGREHDEAAHVSTPPKRRRVSASAIPMPSPIATMEEPP